MMRTLAHTLIIIAVMIVLDALLGGVGGFGVLLGVVGVASFIPFGLATACGINDQKLLLIILVVIVGLSVIPCTTSDFARSMAPIGIGVLLGHGVRQSLPREERDDE